MAFGNIQTIHIGIMFAFIGCIFFITFIENLSNKAARIKPIAIVLDIFSLIFTVCECLVNIEIFRNPIAHNFIPAILQEVRTTI